MRKIIQNALTKLFITLEMHQMGSSVIKVYSNSFAIPHMATKSFLQHQRGVGFKIFVWLP